MADDALGFESTLLGTGDEVPRERDRLARAAAAIHEREPSERERKPHVRSRALVAQLEAALTACGQLGRRRAQRREQRPHQRRLEIELELPARGGVGNLAKEPESLADMLDRLD